MMNRIKKIFVCLIVFVLSIIGATACKSPDVSIVIMDAIDQKELLLNSEFDVTEVVENYNEKYSYEIKECFYLDNLDDLKRYEIPVTGKTKFTQTAPFDVHIVLEANYKGSTAKEEFVLKLIIPENELQEHFRLAWNDSGVSKQIVANKDFLYGNEETAVKVSYLGSSNYDKSNGVTIGSFICNSKENTLTSWDNPVVTCQIYNPQSYDLQIGYQVVKNKKLYNNLGNMYEAITLKAGQWTQANWSLRKVGLNWDFLADGIYIEFKLRIVDTTGLQEPYSYQLYFGALDITDYSAEKFPNLETRTDTEIWEQMNGDLTDKYLYNHIVKDSTTVSKFAPTETNGDVVLYADSQISSPISDSLSYVKYNVVPTALQTSGNYYAVPICFSTKATREALSEDYKELLSAEDWNDVDTLGFEFWIYNDSDTPLKLHLTTEGSRASWSGAKSIAIAESRVWTKITVSLSKDYGYTTSPFNEETYDLMLFAQYARGADDTEWASFNGTFYIDGFDFFNAATANAGDEISKTLSNSAGGSAVHRFYGVDFNTSVIEGSSFEGNLPENNLEWLVKYEALKNAEKFSTTLGDGSSMMGNLISLNQAKLLQIESDVTVLQNGYFGFWLYTDIVNAGNPTLQLDFFVGKHDHVFTNPKIIPDGEWTYVEFSLKEFNDFVIVDGETITITNLNIEIAYGKESVKDGFGETLYIAGFDIYETSKMQDESIAKLLAGKTVGHSGWYTLDWNTSVVGSTDASVPSGTEYKWFTKYEAYCNYDRPMANALGSLMKITQDDLLTVKYDTDVLKTGYIGFWIYTDLQDADFNQVEIQLYSGSFSTSGAKATKVLTSGEWTYVEFALSDFVTDNGDGTITMTDLCIAVKYTACTTGNVITTFDEQTLYVAGFDMYAESKQS